MALVAYEYDNHMGFHGKKIMMTPLTLAPDPVSWNYQNWITA